MLCSSSSSLTQSSAIGYAKRFLCTLERLAMNYRVAFAVCFVLLIGSLLVNLPGRFAVAQEREVVKPVSGRYMVSTIGSTQGIVVCDTFTGQCWAKTDLSAKAAWRDFGSPVKDGK
jgi:hypothetical protein